MSGFLKIEIIRQTGREARLGKVMEHTLGKSGTSTIIVYPENIRLRPFADLLNTAERARARIARNLAEGVVLCATMEEKWKRNELDVIANEEGNRYIDRLGVKGAHYAILTADGLRVKISDALSDYSQVGCDISIIMGRLPRPAAVDGMQGDDARLTISFPNSGPELLGAGSTQIIYATDGREPDAWVAHTDGAPRLNYSAPFQFEVKGTVVEIANVAYGFAMKQGSH